MDGLNSPCLSRNRSLSAAWVALLALASVAACGGPDATTEEDGGPPAVIPAVEVVQARQGAVPLRERATGTVRATGEVAIYPQTSGSVVQVFVQNGATVEKGDPLIRIQTPGSQPQLSQARSTLESARAALAEAEAQHRELAAEYERTAALGRKGLVAANTVDALRSQTEAARAAVTQARAQVNVAGAGVAEQREVQAQTLIRAPIDGRVGQRNAEVGMRVDSQTPLFIVGQLDTMRVEVPVTQEILPRVREGQRVELRVGGNAEPIEARVSRISPFLQADSFSAEVEIDVPNASSALVPGMFVTVDIFYGDSEPATLVPTSALYEDPNTGEQGLFVSGQPPSAAPAAEGGGSETRPAPVEVFFRPVEIVAEADQTVGVTGIDPEAWVVVVGQHLLAAQPEGETPRARVRVIEWATIMELQQLQRDDLLQEFLERQRRPASGGKN